MRRTTARATCAMASVLLFAGTASIVSAQPVRYGVSAGVAIPSGDYVAPHVALTDYGTGADFGRASYSPIAIGVTF